MLKRPIALGVAALLGFVNTALAAPITYHVNRPVGDGSLSGTITTDGALGILTAGDIIAWDLKITGDGGSTRLTEANSGASVGGDDLSATPGQLAFDFGGADDGYLLFRASFGRANRYYCAATALAKPLCSPGESAVPAVGTDTSAQRTADAGRQAIGSIAEPARLGAIGIGQSVLATVRRRLD